MMTHGGKIPREVHYIVIRLSTIMGPEKIAIYTGISRQSVQQILNYFTLHGTVEPEKECKKRDKHLFHQTPDLYVDELQEMLSVSCGQDVSKATIWRMLHRAGYTFKKVHHFSTIFRCIIATCSPFR